MGRKRKFENRYEVIVEAAALLFADRGFESTTMDEIAKACNLGKATVYAEFESKDDLMDAVIIWHLQNSVASVKAKAEQAQGKYLEAVRDILTEKVQSIHEGSLKS